VAKKTKAVAERRQNLSVRLPEDLCVWLGHHALDAKTSARAIVQELLEDYRKRQTPKHGA